MSTNNCTFVLAGESALAALRLGGRAASALQESAVSDNWEMKLHLVALWLFRSLVWTATAAVVIVPLAANAIPDDFRVLTDDMTKRGEMGLELQGAAARPRDRTSAESKRLQGLAEISYGLAENLEVSLQFPGSRESGEWRGNGMNLEAQYIAPHAANIGFYWGARAELGRGRSFGEDASVSSLEVRPIIGYHHTEWHATLNASLRKLLSGNDRRVTWEPSAKLAYHLVGNTFLGVEHYTEAGQRNLAGSDGLILFCFQRYRCYPFKPGKLLHS